LFLLCRCLQWNNRRCLTKRNLRCLIHTRDSVDVERRRTVWLERNRYHCARIMSLLLRFAKILTTVKLQTTRATAWKHSHRTTVENENARQLLNSVHDLNVWSVWISYVVTGCACNGGCQSTWWWREKNRDCALCFKARLVQAILWWTRMDCQAR